MKADRERRRKFEVDLGLRPEEYVKQFTKPNPGITWTWALKLILLFLKPVMAVITPILRRELEDTLIAYYHKAEETENPWDDFLAGFLLEILDIPVPE